MRGSPSVTSVGSGSSATLTAPPETSLMRSVLLPHAALAAATVGKWATTRLLECAVGVCSRDRLVLSIIQAGSLKADLQ